MKHPFGLLALLAGLLVLCLGLTPAETDMVTGLSRQYFDAFFAGREESAGYLLSPDKGMYASEMETRRAKLTEMEATRFDFSRITYAVPHATATRAMVQSNGTVVVSTRHGDLSKPIQRVFEVVNLGGVWRIKNSWYGVYDHAKDAKQQEQEFELIDSTISKEREARYERLYADVKKGKNATDMQRPKKK